MIAAARLVDWLRLAATEIVAQKAELTALDAAIGDADHGLNMERGFRAVLAVIKAEGLAERDAGSIARSAAMALISNVGGAAGPLYGTLLLRMGTSLGAKMEFAPDELAAAIRAGATGLQQRGKAQPGEKTILDALLPGCDALEKALAAGEPLAAALVAAETAAQRGALATIPMLATKGRASYLGERSIGHQDPGATSAWLLIKAAAAAFGPAG
jgi:phosphoenolpyruvate---glycerone phosphotransferase subunit DhaL